MHSDLQRLLDAVDAAEADARQLVRGLTDTQGNWRPDGGAGWSIVQCLEHLAKMNSYYVGPFLDVVEQAYANQRRPFHGVRPTWFGRTWARMQEPPVTRKGKAPSAVVPRLDRPVADALDAYLEGHGPYRRMVELSAHVDVNRLHAWNPFLKVLPVRVATALQVVPAHDRRHLWQARNVLTAPGFPPA